ncbi:MAG: hypothetical protein PVH88_16820 [Ignavibacteria bacterium]
MVTNLPSNILISYLFIALTSSPEFVAEVTVSLPIGMVIDSIFLFVMVLTLKQGLIRSVIISLFSWFVTAYLVSFLPELNWFQGGMIYSILTLLLFLYLEKFRDYKYLPKSNKKYSVMQIIIRAIFAGSIVALIVMLSKILDPFWVGIFSAFPAVLLASMVILVINQSIAFAESTGKLLILSSSNIVVYAFVVFIAYPEIGIIWGTVSALASSFLWVIFINYLLPKK